MGLPVRGSGEEEPLSIPRCAQLPAGPALAQPARWAQRAPDGLSPAAGAAAAPAARPGTCARGTRRARSLAPRCPPCLVLPHPERRCQAQENSARPLFGLMQHDLEGLVYGPTLWKQIFSFCPWARPGRQRDALRRAVSHRNGPAASHSQLPRDRRGIRAGRQLTGASSAISC